MKIDYSQNKKEFVDFLKSTKRFGDYNFTGSNINILLDILSRDAHKYGFYASMLLNETNPKKARQVESLKGYATKHAFLIRNNSSSMTTLSLRIENTNNVNSIYIPRNTKFTGVNAYGQSMTFITIEEYTLFEKDGGYIVGDIVVYEGELKNDLIEIDDLSHFYTIYDQTIDVNTLQVSIKPNKTSPAALTYRQANNQKIPNKLDNVYYIYLEGNNYRIYFGENKFGKQPNVGSFLKLSYLTTSGEKGNTTSNFNLVKDSSIIDVNNIHSCDNVTITSEESSSGFTGVNADNLRTVLTNFSRVKSVAVGDDDYKTVILTNYPDIASIAVWGGEKNNYREYGKLYISIKPVYGKVLSKTMKNDIRDMLVKNYSFVADNVIFTDPYYMYINTDIVFSKNALGKNISNADIKTVLLQKSVEYDKNFIGKFEKIFNEKDYLEYISSDYAGMYNNLYMRKELEFNLQLIFGSDHVYDFDFKNPLLTFKTETFFIDNMEAYYAYDKDVNNVSPIYLYINNENKGQYGEINLDTGQLTLNILEGIKLKSIKLLATPNDNSIETTFDRILQLGNTTVEVK